MIKRFSWIRSGAKIFYTTIVLYVLVKRLCHGTHFPKRENRSLAVIPNSRKHISSREVLGTVVQACIAIATALIAYVIVEPTWSSPAEFQHPVGFVRLMVSCPGIEAVPSVVISDEANECRSQ